MANAKSMAKIQYKFHGPRQICLGFPVLFFYLSWDFSMLIITKLSIFAQIDLKGFLIYLRP